MKLGAWLLAAAAWGGSAFAPWPDGKLVDLTHPFSAETIYWPTEKGFALEKKHAGKTAAGYYYAANRFSAAEHGGTHLDAPRHFRQAGQTADEIPLSRLVARAVVIDVSDKCKENRDYQVLRSDLQLWERRRGRIPDNAIVLIRTGFGRYWPDRKRYLGTDELGEEGVRRLSFPGLNPQAAAWLAEDRKVAAVGIDTASIDHGKSLRFLAHQALAERNVPVFENLANLEQLPETGARVIALPMKIAGGSGAPLRVIAVVP